MKRLAVVTVLAAASLSLAAPALATDTTTRTWFLPAGVTPSDPFASWWPQTVSDPGCSWAQVDTYWYSTPKQRRIVDALDDDGLLVLVNGTPEDSAVYVSHRMVPPGQGCGTPSSTTTTTGGTPSTPPTTASGTATTTPTTSTTSPRPTTSTATATTTSTPSTSATTSPSPSQTSSTPTTPTTTDTATSTSAPTTPPASASTTSARPSHPTSATKSSSPNSPRRSVPSSTVAPPELAYTGLNGLGKAVVIGLILLVLALGAYAYASEVNKGSSRGRH